MTHSTSARISSLVLLFPLAATLTAAEPATVRAPLSPARERQAAPNFALQDAKGKTIRLRDYRNKVVLVDFWATWCTGCKEELPMFSDLQKAYGAKGLVVIGIALDDEGWKVVRPFLASTRPSFAMLLGNGTTAQRYGIGAMPNTFLIDQRGRLAASYRGGLVNREDVEAHIQSLLVPVSGRRGRP